MTKKLSRRDAGLIAGLMYPIIFEQDPLNGVDRTLEVVVMAQAMDARPDDYREALRAALTTSDKLSALLPQPHSEERIRAYLAEIERRLS